MGPVRQIRGRLPDLTRLRASPDVTHVSILSEQIASLAGIERFPNLRVVALWPGRSDDLTPLLGVRDRLEELSVQRQSTRSDFGTIEQLHRLEKLTVSLVDEQDTRNAQRLRLDRLPRLSQLCLAGEGHGLDLDLTWTRTASALRYLIMPAFGIRDEDADLVCEMGRNWRGLHFAWRSAQQTAQIEAALAGSCTVTSYPPMIGSPIAGQVNKGDGDWWMWLGFPSAETGEEQEEAMGRLMSGKWRDLANLVDWERSGDAVFVHAADREVLEDMSRRAAGEGVL